MLEAESGSSLMTVFNPIEEMSLSCSLSEHIFVHKCSTMVSTWTSFTLVTSGPKLKAELNSQKSTAQLKQFMSF